MRDIKINWSSTWEVQLTIAINFIFSKDADEERVIHSKSNNTELMTYDNANDIVDELFESLFSRYQIGLEASMRETNFIFDTVQLYCKCYKINFKRNGLCINSAD